MPAAAQPRSHSRTAARRVCRFTAKLRTYGDMVARCLDAVTGALHAELPERGRTIAVDGSDMTAYANGQRFKYNHGPESETFSDPDASWGHRSAVSTRKGGGFYGYKLDMAVCTAQDGLGPNDPHLGEGAVLAREIMRGRVPAGIPGGVPVVDVSNVAAVHAAVMDRGRGRRRYLATGDFVPAARLFELLGGIASRRLSAAPAAPSRSPRAAGPVAHAAQRKLSFRCRCTGGPWTIINARPGGDSSARERLGGA